MSSADKAVPLGISSAVMGPHSVVILIRSAAVTGAVNRVIFAWLRLQGPPAALIPQTRQPVEDRVIQMYGIDLL
jgi:hypothetical protein